VERMHLRYEVYKKEKTAQRAVFLITQWTEVR